MRYATKCQYRKMSEALGTASLDGLSAEQPKEIGRLTSSSADTFMMSCQIPIKCELPAQRWFFVLTVFILSAVSLAQPLLGLPTADPASVGMSSDALAAITSKLAPLIDKGKVPGFVTVVARQGKVVHFEAFGQRDVERGEPMTKDTIFRMYSMTKPITGVAIMILVDDGKLKVCDPVSKFIPEFANSKVVVNGKDGSMRRVSAKTPMTIQHLLTHTSGLTYGMEPKVAVFYLKHGVFTGLDTQLTLEEYAKRAAKVPLICEPGSAWHYGISMDVLGRIVEVVAKQPFDEFLQSRIFKPLGMKDTGFSVPLEDVDRFAANYMRKKKGRMQLIEDPKQSPYLRKPSFLSGGAGTVGTATDYLRFAQMILNGGELDGVRIVSEKSVAELTKQQLPPELGNNPMGNIFPMAMEGVGFGYAGAVVKDSYDKIQMGSAGTYTWGGLANTDFWIDRKQELIGIVLTQLMPSGAHSTRARMLQATNAAIVEWKD